MDAKEFYNVLKQDFGHQTTTRQDIALQKLSEFILDSEPEELFLLKGFAGTGKTTITSTIVKNIWKVRKSVVLAAPTGRAAKVLGNYAKQNAQTIHRKIYFPKSKNNNITFSLRPNKHRNTLFIVDEASMIPDMPSDAKLFENGSLLNDLIEFVDAGFKCRLLLIGDTAQLPPVKLDISPALDEKKLMLDYNREVTHIELNEVVRQSIESDILLNATQIRHILEDGFYESFKFNITQKGDVIRLIDGHEIMDAINDSYSQLGHEDTCIVVRSNKRANLYNQNIRQRILFQEEEISAGDYFMVVKNNYFWVKPTTDAGFIANGDIVKVLEIFAIKELYGFRFAEVNVQMVDYPNMKPFETVVLLDTLTSNTASLSFEESNQLYQEVMKDYADVKTKYQKFLKVKNNKFFNALQVKFSYAITCHKSQGGQWDTVFVEQPYLPDGIDKDYLRWLYTAITRAKSKLYLIGFKNEMFEDNSF
ncbi:ATP-dependent DNA helicase [Croceibacter atlanticus]|jgi:exodeoxyribonuclease-5|uniref:ATP-dependent DNA helicase n=1 Tax=Croceibacter atlanticus TaxID=313588 RepID=UPI0024BA2132|nr:AAA family ATPase [Croceibacter atlanticus]